MCTHTLTCTCTGTLHNGPLEAAGGKRAIALFFFSPDNDDDEDAVIGCCRVPQLNTLRVTRYVHPPHPLRTVGKRAIALFSGDDDDEEEVVAGCWLLVVAVAAFIS